MQHQKIPFANICQKGFFVYHFFIFAVCRVRKISYLCIVKNGGKGARRRAFLHRNAL